LDTIWAVLVVVVPVLLIVTPIIWAVAAAFEGRNKTPGAGWLVRQDRDDVGSWVDERMISKALAHLGIAPLKQFFKDGGHLTYTVAARKDGDGTYAQIRLPLGVTADMVAVPDWPPTLAGRAWRPGPPRAKKTGSWTCGWPTRAPCPVAPASGRCRTMGRSICLKVSRLDCPNAVSLSMHR
jgi:hypothetical protein